MKLTIGIIGTGRFATVLNKLLSRNPNWQIQHSSTTQSIDGRKIVCFAELAKCDIIIPAVPISALPGVLKQLADHLPLEHSPLVMSVCSVMSAPEHWLLTELPDHLDLLVTHPLFGPFSSQQGTVFSKLKWIWHPVRVNNKNRLSELVSFLREQEFDMILMSSNHHDQIMAKTQLWSFIVGRLGMELGLESTQLDTAGFIHLLKNQAIVASDSRQLFIDLCTHNPQALEQLHQCSSHLSRWQIEVIKNKNTHSLTELRQHIDQIDHQLLLLLSSRLTAVKAVGELKKKQHLPPLQPARWQEVMSNLLKTAEALEVPAPLVQDIWNRIHDEALVLETAIKDKHET